MKNWSLIVVAAALGSLPGPVVFAADCEPFVVHIPDDGRQFTYIYFKQDGRLSAGDKGIGRDMLRDGHGNQIGRVFVIQEIHEVDGDGLATKWADNQVFVFENGAIFGYAEVDGPTLDAHMTNPDTLKKQNLKVRTEIIGGTGAYSDARGTVDLSVESGDATAKMNVTCK